MAYSAKILLDSVNTTGNRLTTFQITFPRIVLAEYNTHRALSRNAASSRAIPVTKMIRDILSDPFVPIWWGKNQGGMQANTELTGWRQWAAEFVWTKARYGAVAAAYLMVKLGLHKQIANRLLEPWAWTTIITSATEWENFFRLRNHKDAMPEIRFIAAQMETLYKLSKPRLVMTGDTHIPMIDYDDVLHYSLDELFKIATGRIARVSLLTHEGKRDPSEDVKLFNRLAGSTPMHASPFEHSAIANPAGGTGNFVGWDQFRHAFANESVSQPLYFPPEE